MKVKWLLPFFALVLLLAGGCKKDKDTVVSPVVGTWRLPYDSIVYYYVFKPNGDLIEALEFPGGLRTKSTEVYHAYDKNVLLNNSLCAFRISGDSLIISATPDIVLLKNADVNVDDWVGSFSISNKITLPALSTSVGALEWNGTEFLLSNFFKRIYKLSTAGVFTDSVDIPTKSYGVCYHNGKIYTNGGNVDSKLREISFVTGAELSFSSPYSQKFSANTTDGTDIWCISEAGKLISYNPTIDAFTTGPAVLPFSSGSLTLVSDMSIKDGYAYGCSAYTGILKINLTTGRVERNYINTSGTAIIYGIAHANGKLMAVCADGGSVYLAEIQLN